MNKDSGLKNIFFLLISVAILGWGISYNNCGSENVSSTDSNQSSGAQQNTNVQALTGNVKQIDQNLSDLSLVTAEKQIAPKLTAEQSKILDQFSQTKSSDVSQVVTSSAPFLSNGSPNGIVKAITLQSNQYILIGGCFTSYHGVAANRILRLKTDGSRDTTFTIGTGISGGANIISSNCFGVTSVQAIAVQSNGKILVGGNFSSYNGTSRNALVRLNANGTVDNTFNIGTGFSLSWSQQQYTVNSIVVLSSGKILVGGVFDGFNGASVASIVRLNSNGTLDTSFNLGGAGPKLFLNPSQQFGDPCGYVYSLDVNPSTGDIYVGGNFAKWNGNSARVDFVKLSANGALNNTFAPVIAYGVNVNKVLFSASRNSVLIAREVWDPKMFEEFDLQTGAAFPDILNGVPWPHGGWMNLPDVYAKTIALLPNGDIMGGATDASGVMASNGQRPFSALYYMPSSTGLVNLTYGNVRKFPATPPGYAAVYALAVQADGKILVGGDFNTHIYPHTAGTQTTVANLIRINPTDGTIAP